MTTIYQLPAEIVLLILENLYLGLIQDANEQHFESVQLCRIWQTKVLPETLSDTVSTAWNQPYRSFPRIRRQLLKKAPPRSFLCV